MEILKTVMENRKRAGLGLQEAPKKTTMVRALPPTAPGQQGPTEYQKLQDKKLEIIAKKPRNAVVREYFQDLIDYKCKRKEAKEQEEGEK